MYIFFCIVIYNYFNGSQDRKAQVCDALRLCFLSGEAEQH